MEDIQKKKMRFDDRLLGKEEIVERAGLIAAQNMIAIIKSYKDEILVDDRIVSLYLSSTLEMEQYFRKHKLTNNALISSSLAILDDLTQKGDPILKNALLGVKIKTQKE